MMMGNREPANSSTDELEALICARTKAAVRSRRRPFEKTRFRGAERSNSNPTVGRLGIAMNGGDQAFAPGFDSGETDRLAPPVRSL
jgi:hypothetical protein